MNQRIPLFKIFCDDKDINEVSKVMRSGMDWANGPMIGKFEQKLADFLGIKYCATLNSGSSALYAALLSIGIKKNDEVIVPSFTFPATVNAVLILGAKPVFADIEKTTLGLDPEDVLKKISHKTKAILPIHYGGCPCNISAIADIAARKRIILIEDAAEALGAKANNQYVGTFGKMGILSFCQNKIITTGEGGAIITKSREIYTKIKSIRSWGHNLRMSSLAAALGHSQLRKVNSIIRMRQKAASYFACKLRHLTQEIEVLPKTPAGYFNVNQLFAIYVKSRRNQLMRHLADRGISTKIYFKPMHRIDHILPNTNNLSRHILNLPIYPAMSKREIDTIVSHIKDFYF